MSPIEVSIESVRFSNVLKLYYTNLRKTLFNVVFGLRQVLERISHNTRMMDYVCHVLNNQPRLS